MRFLLMCALFGTALAMPSASEMMDSEMLDKNSDGCTCMEHLNVNTDMFRSYMDEDYGGYENGMSLNELKQLVVTETAELLKKSARSDQAMEARMFCGGPCVPNFKRAKRTCNRLLLESWALASYQPTCIMTALQILSTCCRDMLK
ncbi:uncharacterized protein LOC122244907 [Penaeus japonicus]|uniref:uncharacterized protein LOC122244907 n=1 Tax=Penaeus japonicus TaxID=27405 RepID=UPI001C7112D4|nr:uncharacterized protein LOC122244907 [Penaeus japonicus]